jgi:5,10-methylenetetrahydromethanopterin reductase
VELGCLFMSRLETPDHIELAERLGYSWAAVADVPSLMADPWATLARAVDRTSTIRLAVLVTTPRVRHVVATASAAATLNSLAPGRFELGVGPGSEVSHSFLGERPAPWSEVEAYISGLRTLLAGEELEWNGSVVALCHSPASGVVLPAEVPIWAAAHGPRAFRNGARCADKIITFMRGVGHVGLAEGKPVFSMYYGTVLEDGEDPSSDRVFHAAGPFAALTLHRGEVPDTPAGAEYRRAVEAVDERRRHLQAFGRHLISVREWERPLVTGDLIMRTTGSGTADQVRERLEQMRAAGIAGVLYGPLGDVPRELAAFAAVASEVG